MKKDYIKLYLDNVVSRLPQKDREEVRKELSSNIYDMLSDDAGEAEIKAVLESLGPPKKLAEKYRTNPRYLISPAVFDNYIRVLIIGVPAVALLSAFVGFMVALVGVITNNITEVSEIMSQIIGAFISSLYSGAAYSAVLITLGFIIYEHTDKTIEKEKPKSWTVEQLKEVNLAEGDSAIPLVGSVVSIVVTVCLSIFFMLFAAGVLPAAVWIKHNDIVVYNFFSAGFLRRCLYVIPVLAVAAILTDVLKIKHRKWNKAVLYSAISTSLMYMGGFAFLFSMPDIISAEFAGFLQSLPADSPALIDALVSGKIIAVVTIAIVVIIGLVSIGMAAYKLLKMKDNDKNNK